MNIRNRKNKMKVFSITFGITIILIVILLNLLVGIAESRFSLKLDMTGSKVFSLSEETEEFLSNLEEEFTIYVLSDEMTYKNGLRTGIINEILLQYKRTSNSNIELTYVDTYKNPGILSKYQDENIKENQLIIEGENGYKVISMSELFGTETSPVNFKEQIVDLTAEKAITSALARLSADTLKKVYLVTGHGETYSDSIVKTMESGAYELGSISLMGEEIPADADLIIICSPRVDFSFEEITHLDQYLQKFGNMILLYGSETLDLPNLDKYLEEWGVKFEKNIIIDPTRYIGSILQLSPSITDIEINKNIKGFDDRYLLTPGARNINILWDSKNKRETSPALITSDKAYAKSYDNETGLISTIEQREEDVKGSANIGVLVQNYDLINKEVQVGRALFLSSPSMLNDSLINTPNLLNNYYFSDAVAYMSGAKDSISIQSKSMRDNALVTADIGNLTLFIIIVIIPSLSILLFGILRFRHRRRL